MPYKHLGSLRKAGCTPAPMTTFNTRSCRERTNCSRECNPKTLKCDRCGNMFSSLNHLENTETKEQIYVCYECKDELEKNE